MMMGTKVYIIFKCIEQMLEGLGLEAVADYDLWLQHSYFNHPGSLNDINIWDKSPLLQEFLDGTFSEDVDFEFEINGTVSLTVKFLLLAFGSLLMVFIQILPVS